MPAPAQTPEGIPAGAIVESDSLLAAPLWRREPYLLLFPLGVALSWAGVLHWLLHALGLLGSYRAVFHALAQIQGFLMSFAVGFLFTMIPRRTGSAPPSAVEMSIALVAPPAVVLAAWHDQWLVSQLAWLALAATVIAFAVRRFLSATSRRRPPNAFVWIPLALAMGITGSIVVAASDRLGVEQAWLVDLGRGLLLQGMFTGLVLGVGALALPLMTRGEAPPDAGAGVRETAARAAMPGPRCCSPPAFGSALATPWRRRCSCGRSSRWSRSFWPLDSGADRGPPGTRARSGQRHG